MVCVRVAGEGGGVGSRGRSLSRSAPAHAAGGRAVADASLLPLQPSKAVQATPRALAAGVHATATLPPPPPPHPASIRRCLFISGAGTGIGAATVAAAVGAGYHVFAGVLVAAEGEALVATHGVGAVTPLPLDVTRADSINAAVSAAAAAMGPGLRLVALVNNAGVLRAGPLLSPRAADDARAMLDVNFHGTLALTRAAAGPLLGIWTDGGAPAWWAGGGKGAAADPPPRVVAMSSLSARLPTAMSGGYAASKAALEAACAALRQELAPWRVDVCVVEPGVVKGTRLWGGAGGLGASLAGTAWAGPAAAFDRVLANSAAAGLDPAAVAAEVVALATRPHPRARTVMDTGGAFKWVATRAMPDRLADDVAAAIVGLTPERVFGSGARTPRPWPWPRARGILARVLAAGYDPGA